MYLMCSFEATFISESVNLFYYMDQPKYYNCIRSNRTLQTAKIISLFQVSYFKHISCTMNV